MGGCLAAIFAHLGIPTSTLPFCLGTLAFVLLQDSVAGLVPVPLVEVTTLEGHRVMKMVAAAAATEQEQEQKRTLVSAEAAIATVTAAAADQEKGWWRQ